MRKLLLLLPLLAAPPPAAAQSGSQEFCLANRLNLTPTRVKITQITANGREATNDWVRVPPMSRHCARFVRAHAVRFQVEARQIVDWAFVCNWTVSQPSGGAILRVTGNLSTITCGWE
ncbi:hypothetical protein KTR66_01905 [Roseococcus sp. SDR]|uniref:hypothetical protein n=1 Tax=Roseococcus sp. SDR TaxID=2835532 RepID=UPI001BCB011E|nr:hypothetical protein [Roseococcus sp. SDR]MBS7788728.1 hypothetical protein [Roseococcus sp. SDR]MBV1844042.1 hypothetical protein [Roseococcus sp. SDR]